MYEVALNEPKSNYFCFAVEPTLYKYKPRTCIKKSSAKLKLVGTYFEKIFPIIKPFIPSKIPDIIV